MENERTPPEVREGVRSAILTSIERDVELRGGRTARLLAAAGIVGILGSIAVTLFSPGYAFGNYPPWRVAIFSAVWAGLLIVSFAIAFLKVRTPSLPLARSAVAGILGLGLAGICGAVCPDQRCLQWWSGTAIGGSLTTAGGLTVSALCFGLVTALFFGGISAFLVLGDRRRPVVKPLLPASVLLILLAPGVALQSVDTSLGVFAGWLAGTAAGVFAGVAAGIWARSLFPAPRAR